MAAGPTRQRDHCPGTRPVIRVWRVTHPAHGRAGFFLEQPILPQAARLTPRSWWRLPPAHAKSRMPHSILFAKSIATLLEEVQSAADMTMVRSGLLRVRRFSRSHGLTLELSEGSLIVNGEKPQKPDQALQRIVLAMTTHEVGRIILNPGAVPRELLKLAMVLVRPKPQENTEASIFEEIRDASLWYVQVLRATAGTDTDTDTTTPAAAQLEAPDDVAASIRAMQRDASAAIALKDVPSLAGVLANMARIEKAIADRDLKAQWTSAFDQSATSEVLRTLVIALPTSGHHVDVSIAVLKRAGEAGADVLIEQLLQSESIDVRRACYDALVQVRRGTDRLVNLLEHAQWFVARNAACLLGAYQSRTSEPELTRALTHADERVRAAVVAALLQLDTPTARAAVRGAIHDKAPEVRRRAVRGFLVEKGAPVNAEKLLKALGRETELDVQVEFLYALGTLATPEAVQKLIRLCSTEGKYRPSEFRIAAAEALASARLGASVPLLRAMLKDPDVHARAAARHLIRAVS